jgi:RimJ/RimL family protein N-acetyltransferase
MTEGLSLREVTLDDVAEFYRHQVDPAAYRMAAFPPREEEAFLAHWTRIRADETVLARAIVFDGRVVGYVAAFDQDGRRHVGYWIGREHWGRGIATRALAGFLSEMRTRPVYARVARHNGASLRVLQKCGFSITEEDVGLDSVNEIILVLTVESRNEEAAK